VREDTIKSAARRLLDDGVHSRVFSGAQAAWWLGGERRIDSVFSGTTSSTSGTPVDGETFFDIASLTKPFTASSAFRLAARGVIDLRETLGERLPELMGVPQARATLTQVLAHEAGFVPWVPLFESVPLELRGTTIGKNSMLDALARTPPASTPDGIARYSDLGFISLGVFLERATSTALDSLIEREVSQPLGLTRTRFRPSGIAAATADCPWRKRLLIGEVHDDNAWTMGGVSGHAGLFSTASDIATFGAAYLNALEGDESWLPCNIVEEAVLRRKSGRGLGFDLKSETESSAGERLARNAFGHLGFTGCSLWIDAERRFAVALLTNRVHVADMAAIKAFRPRFHDELLRAFDRL
jgi:serine-type D-Ala-D-Ala carboxypeptidase